MADAILPHLLTIILVEERPCRWSADWSFRPSEEPTQLHGRITEILATNAPEARLLAIPRCLRALDETLA